MSPPSPPNRNPPNPPTQRWFTIQNWEKIGIGLKRSHCHQTQSIYYLSIGSLGAITLHREIDSQHRVTIEIANKDGSHTVSNKVWIGSVVFNSPAELLDIFTGVILSNKWV